MAILAETIRRPQLFGQGPGGVQLIRDSPALRMVTLHLLAAACIRGSLRKKPQRQALTFGWIETT